MNTDKSLIQTKKMTIYQREILVDKIKFLIPQKYEDLNLEEFKVVLKYIDQGNVAHAEYLRKEDALYENMLSYVLPINTSLTQFCGAIKIRLSFLHINDSLQQEVLHTGETTISIQPLSDLYSFVGDNSLEILDKKLLEIEGKIKAVEILNDVYDKTKADNIIRSIDKDSQIKVQLTSNGVPIGNEITVGDDLKAGVPIVDIGSKGDFLIPDKDETEEENDVVEF